MDIAALLRDGLAAAVAGSANTLLRHDTATVDALSRLAGKVIELHIAPPDVRWFCVPQREGIQVLASANRTSDVVIKGSLPALLMLALQISRDESALNNSSVHIQGDSELLQDVMRTVRGLDIDWEALLSRVTGDVIAHQAGRMARSANKWAGAAQSELARQLSGYLQEELQLLPSRNEVNSFCNDVDGVSLAVDRLHARLQQLRTTPSGPAT